MLISRRQQRHPPALPQVDHNHVPVNSRPPNHHTDNRKSNSLDGMTESIRISVQQEQRQEKQKRLEEEQRERQQQEIFNKRVSRYTAPCYN